MSLKEQCPILHFGDLGDERGKLVVIEGGQAIPFEIKRVFYIYDSDDTVVRGQHANRESEFVLVNVAGESKVRITCLLYTSCFEIRAKDYFLDSMKFLAVLGGTFAILYGIRKVLMPQISILSFGIMSVSYTHLNLL